MHEQFNRDVGRLSVDKEKSLAWLCSLGIKGEIEFDNSSPRSSTSICVTIRTSWSNQLKVNAECAIRQNTQNILLQEAQNLHPLTTLIDTIRRLVTATGQKINIWGYRLLTSTMNIPERVIIVNRTTIMWDIPVITDRKILANQPAW